MDATDFKILEILQSDGRIAMKKLAEQINMSTPATIERVKKLEENQGIVGYKAIIRPDRVGREVSAFVLVDIHRDQRTDFEQTFDEAAERICGSIQAGDVDAADRYMKDQLWKIAKNCMGMPYPTTLNLTINRFLSLLQYRLTDQNLADWRYITQMDFSRDLVASPTLEAYLAEGRTIVEKLIEHHRLRTSDRYDSLMHDMRAYIVENVTDMNMGLTSVSREFKLKPRETAESFRKYFGESINDVIHKTRVAKAKRLLLETDDSVQEIAEAVGYCSLATMYRAFTNVEGVAPGRLRKTRSN